MLKLAIIKRPKLGCEPSGKYMVLTFEAYISENEAAIQRLAGNDIEKAIVTSKVDDVNKLDGLPCWVECEGVTIKFTRMCSIS